MLAIVSKRTVYKGKAQAASVIGWIYDLHDAGCENEACVAAIAEGRTVHAIPRTGTLPSYHFKTRNEAFDAIDAQAV